MALTALCLFLCDIYSEELSKNIDHLWHSIPFVHFGSYSDADIKNCSVFGKHVVMVTAWRGQWISAREKSDSPCVIH